MSDDVIIAKVRELQRIYSGVLPCELVGWLPFKMSIGYARKTMRRLWLEGKLIRIGGAGARRGYIAPVAVSRLKLIRVSCVRQLVA